MKNDPVIGSSAEGSTSSGNARLRQAEPEKIMKELQIAGGRRLRGLGERPANRPAGAGLTTYAPAICSSSQNLARVLYEENTFSGPSFANPRCLSVHQFTTRKPARGEVDSALW